MKKGLKEGPKATCRYLGEEFRDSDLILGFAGAVGVDLERVESDFTRRLEAIGYSTSVIRITKSVIPKTCTQKRNPPSKEYERISRMMDLGNRARKISRNNAILAAGAAAEISTLRSEGGEKKRRAFLIHSLKHPDEVRLLREVYPRGFYLVGVHSARDRRLKFLTEERRMSKLEADEIMDRDMDEKLDHGQRIIDTFHLSDFFIRLYSDDDQLRNSVFRIVDTMFGNPFSTPTFGEYAMFLAFAASLRSGDLSRQVGAVIARDAEILAAGANDCPKPGGGLYWPHLNPSTKAIEDVPNGRDCVRGKDLNKGEQSAIIESILAGVGGRASVKKKVRKALESSAIKDLTEFGRVVHAEMECLLSCARKGISTKGATMYCTTFPCHNCAKHIIAAGIERVVFIEPYAKSKAIKLHSEAIKISYDEGSAEQACGNNSEAHVRFEPFVGVGPRRYFDLFSMNLGVGYPLKRKDTKGLTIKWKPEGANSRIQMLPRSYLDLESEAAELFQDCFPGNGSA